MFCLFLRCRKTRHSSSVTCVFYQHGRPRINRPRKFFPTLDATKADRLSKAIAIQAHHLPRSILRTSYVAEASDPIGQKLFQQIHRPRNNLKREQRHHFNSSLNHPAATTSFVTRINSSAHLSDRTAGFSECEQLTQHKSKRMIEHFAAIHCYCLL